MANDWNPEQYARFRDQRAQPFWDLLALIRPAADLSIVDLGCGTGELTRELSRHLQAREVLGIDLSDAMLERCTAHAGNGIRFVKQDLATFVPTPPVDVIFSNAAVHWVADHPKVLARLATGLTPGGQLAVQVPANHDHPSHTVAADIAREAPFAAALGGYVREPSVLLPEQYAVHLDRLGFRAQHVRLQVYAHHLASRDDVVEWVKGTLLVDYQQRMSAELFVEFLTRYRARLMEHLEDARPYFYPFKRILLWAQR